MFPCRDNENVGNINEELIKFYEKKRSSRVAFRKKTKASVSENSRAGKNITKILKKVFVALWQIVDIQIKVKNRKN